MERKLIYSVTKDHFEVQTFRAGGKGGQNQNKTNSGVRIIHKESGAVGEARDTRSQVQNKKAAFQRLIATPKFKIWHRMKIATIIMQGESIDKKVADAMKETNLRVDVKDEKGLWTKENPDGK